MGRVEVFRHGQWGTVRVDKNERLETNFARVVCRMLGYFNGSVISWTKYGADDQKVWMDQVECDGTETSIVDCLFYGPEGNYILHRADRGVVCCKYSKRNYFPRRIVD